ncbi:MAG: anthranilate phosphoribosyltransferase, partial [Candidatus Eremiobacteraeota bacterium]|nr:anthranilate phosphoribosyltransferase [Candidatus Eremiobacteraeota bacterium]
ARESQLEMMGDVLRGLGVQAGAIVHGTDGIDEVGGDGPTLVYSFTGEGTRRWTLDPRDYGIQVPLEAIRGGSVERCREAFERTLSGERSPRAEVVALNAALVLSVCGAAATLSDGLAAAREILSDGRAFALLERVRGFSFG